MSNIFRINKFSLIRMYNNITIGEYYNTRWRTLDDEKIFSQFIIKNNDLDDSDIIDRTVWFDGDFAHRLNKTYSTDKLYDPREYDLVIQNKVESLSVMVIQGFSWQDIFGLLFIIRNIKTRDIVLSTMLYQNDFHPTEEKELINGAFWLEEVQLKIPHADDLLEVEIIDVHYKDIISDGSNIGYIYTFPKDLIPLISEKQIPDYIQTVLSLDTNNYLTITPITFELKTLEQSILDYFDVKIAQISIKHIIKYGIDSLGYKSISIVNEDNIYGPINIGLDLHSFSTPDNDTCLIFVSTEITVDGKLIKRENNLTTKLLLTLNPLVAGKINLPEIKYPLILEVENVINQQVIEAKEKLKTVVIYQPLFAQFIQNEFKIENKNIYFDSITSQSLLIVGEEPDIQQLMSEKTEDNRIYFDLGKLEPVAKETIYSLMDINSGKIIGSGKILK